MFDTLEDTRVHCTSIMTSMTAGEYLDLVEHVYKKKGGIEGQRSPLKTKTAVIIRNRMVSDLQTGAVIPPIVVGVLLSDTEQAELAKLLTTPELVAFFQALDADKISIIDGMQRTTALKEAEAVDPNIRKRKVRVEFWVTKFINSLIYRMLVLNTGQVPWELARQLETVYSQFLKKITAELGDDDVAIFLKDDQRRRANAAQYQGSRIIELLLVFSSRKTEVEVRDQVAEDFARLDAVETSAHAEFIEFFVEMLRYLARLDRAFSRLGPIAADAASRFDAGKDIFGGLPAMAGFAAAVSVYLFDEPGFKLDWTTATKKMTDVRAAMDSLLTRLEKMNESELRDFMQLGLLQELTSGRRGGVGRYERELFKKAFTAMLKFAGRLESLEPCWRAT